MTSRHFGKIATWRPLSLEFKQSTINRQDRNQLFFKANIYIREPNYCPSRVWLIILFHILTKYCKIYFQELMKSTIIRDIMLISSTAFGLHIGIFPKRRLVIWSKYAGFQFVPAHLFPRVAWLLLLTGQNFTYNLPKRRPALFTFYGANK